MEIWKKQMKLAIESVFVNEQTVCFFMCDGRTISMSLTNFTEFNGVDHDKIRNCEIIDGAQAVFWPELNKTISLCEVLRS